MNSHQSLGLYLHIPFCRHRCSYCDFNTYTTLGDLKEEYVEAMSREIGQVADEKRRSLSTIYFGGGTPTLLSPRSLNQIIQAVHSHFDLLPDSEVTVESNPETVNSNYLRALRDLAINRISFGAQSANDNELALLGRRHDFATVIQAVQAGRKAGFQNINLDLIYGLPDQDLPSWENSLRTALDLAPEHLSLYCLTIERGTPMYRWLENGAISTPDPDLTADQYDLACQILGNFGYIHYEISNWALPGHECQHNMTYWRNQEYLGLGAGAHGHVNGYRYWTVKQPRVYNRRVMGQNTGGDFPWSAALAHRHKLGLRESMSDTIITQLRLLHEGLDLEMFAAKFGQDLRDAYPGITELLLEWDLLTLKDKHLLLSRRGRYLSNQVFYRYV